MSTADELEPIHFLGLRFRFDRRRKHPAYHAYLFATLFSLICTPLSWALQSWFGVNNGFLIFLLGVAVTAVIYGRGPSIWASCVSTALLAFFFMPPIFSFAVSDIQHVFTLLVMATIGVVISALATQVMHQAEAAQCNARRFEALYRLSRELADLAGSEHLARATVKHIQSVVGGTATVLFPDPRRDFRPVPAAPLATEFRAREWTAARAAFDSRETVGLGTHTTSNAVARFIPLKIANEVLGILAAQPPAGSHDFTEEQSRMVEMLTDQLTGALERDRLSHQVQTAQGEVESERMRAALLSSVSHDLRTPLAVVAGASSSMLDDDVKLSDEARRQLCSTILDNANRLARIVDNLLNMTRIESGMFKVAKQMHVFEEVVGTALRSLADGGSRRRVHVHIPADLPMVPMDDCAVPSGARESHGQRTKILAARHADRLERRTRRIAATYRSRRSRAGLAGGRRTARLRQILSRAGRTTGPSGQRARPDDLPRHYCGPRRLDRRKESRRRRRGFSIVAAAHGQLAERTRDDRFLNFDVGLGACTLTDSAPSILVVDDEDAIRNFLLTTLDGAGYRTTGVATGQEALATALRSPPDLIVLDLCLPDLMGDEVLVELRHTSRLPVIVLSAVGDEIKKVEAFNAGADDYLTKPFGVPELLVRVRAVLRRAVPSLQDEAADKRFQVGELVMDFAARRVFQGPNEIRLTPTEYRLLSLMALPFRQGSDARLLARSGLGAGASGRSELPACVHGRATVQARNGLGPTARIC
ncbi:MAG: DUF4118 domain-containing protein [Pirellulales bacterium]